MFFDNTFRSWFDLGKTSRKAYAFGAEGGDLNYYFIPGPAPADVVRRYSKLVGAAPPPSAAAKSITATAINGWVFWNID